MSNGKDYTIHKLIQANKILSAEIKELKELLKEAIAPSGFNFITDDLEERIEQALKK